MILPEFIKHPVETAKTAPVTATLLLGNTAALGYVASVHVEGNLRFAWIVSLLALGATERSILHDLRDCISERKTYENEIRDLGITEYIADGIYEEGLNGRSTIRQAMQNSGYGPQYYQIKDALKSSPALEA